MKSGHIQRGASSILSSIILVILVIGVTGVIVLWSDTRDMQRAADVEGEVFSPVPLDEPFLFDTEDVPDQDLDTRIAYVEQRVVDERERLIAEEQSFIDVDLVAMELRVYENGRVLHTFPVLGKGRAGSWWETPPGRYVVENKLENHFSSIWDVWMPYSIQFYGNFFIHGWPYWADGTPLSPGPSGGCIRMETADARTVFAFAQSGMPLLVYERAERAELPVLSRTGRTPYVPSIAAPQVLVADVDTRHLLLNNRADELIPAGPMLHMILGLTAAESISLERTISLRSWMIAGMEGERILTTGESYRAFDLLYPLLMRGSPEAGILLSYFRTPDIFLERMNAKARAVGMNATYLADVTGVSDESVTTLSDGALLMRYILDIRSFLFGVGRGVYYPQGVGRFTSLENDNILHNDPALIGVASGGGDEQTAFTLWNMQDRQGNTRNIFIGVARSPDAVQDIHEIQVWLEHQFGVTPQAFELATFEEQ